MREKLSELTNEIIEERSEKTVCETRYTSGSSPLKTWSRMVELKVNLTLSKSMQQEAVANARKTQQAVAKSKKATRTLNL